MAAAAPNRPASRSRPWSSRRPGRATRPSAVRRPSRRRPVRYSGLETSSAISIGVIGEPRVEARRSIAATPRGRRPPRRAPVPTRRAARSQPAQQSEAAVHGRGAAEADDRRVHLGRGRRGPAARCRSSSPPGDRARRARAARVRSRRRLDDRRAVRQEAERRHPRRPSASTVCTARARCCRREQRRSAHGYPLPRRPADARRSRTGQASTLRQRPGRLLGRERASQLVRCADDERPVGHPRRYRARQRDRLDRFGCDDRAVERTCRPSAETRTRPVRSLRTISRGPMPRVPDTAERRLRVRSVSAPPEVRASRATNATDRSAGAAPCPPNCGPSTGGSRGGRGVRVPGRPRPGRRP